MNPVLVVLATALVLMGIERLVPLVRQPVVPGWWPRAAGINLAQVAVVYVGGVSWDRWLPGLAAWHAESLGDVPAVLLGYLCVTFVFYWWHRARHEVPALWRVLHQVHHSASRIEVATSFYKHPLEMLINSALMSVLLYLLLGLDPVNASLVVTIAGVAELLYHANLRTPHWLGYFFQRPESHRRHHELGHHRDNYSDLPLWDILFGTFHNPRNCPRECGFGGGRERQLLRMLLGRRPGGISS